MAGFRVPKVSDDSNNKKKPDPKPHKEPEETKDTTKPDETESDPELPADEEEIPTKDEGT